MVRVFSKGESSTEARVKMRRGPLFFLLSLAMGVAAAAAGELFKVGGEEGWREPGPGNAEMYALWAGRTRFRVGDSIYFQYSNDSVVQVDKRGYYHCDESNATAAYDDGETVIKLEKPGLLYFVSGVAGHCKSGQRLIVDVMEQRPPSQPPTTPAIPGPSEAPLPSAAGPATAPPSLGWAAAALAAPFLHVSLLWAHRHSYLAA